MTDTIGFIGLGVMGAGMAKNIIKAGFQLVATTSSAEKADAFRALGAEIVDSPAEIASCTTLIVTCVPDAAALRQTLSGDNGLSSASWEGGLLVDCSTIAPFEAEEMAAALADVGAGLVDAPVSGGRKGAEEGKLTIMCGGSDADVARARPVLDAMGTNIHHVGPLGAGQAVKACNQLMVAVNMMGAFEAVALARAAGVDPKVMREVLSSGAARSGVLEAHALRYIEGNLEPGFRAELMRKDLGICLAEAKRNGATLPVTALVDQFYAEVEAMGGKRWDTSALLARLER